MLKFEPICETVEKIKNNVEFTRNVGNNIIGLSTGFTDLDRLIEGLKRKELILIGARPTMGTSSFYRSIICNLLFEKYFPVAVFSLDDSKEIFLSKLASTMTGIRICGFNDYKKLDVINNEKLMDALDKIGKSGLIIDSSMGITIRNIVDGSRVYKENFDIKAIFIDYLELIGSEAAQDGRSSQLKDIMISLKQLAEELEIPVIVLTKLSREVEAREDCRPLLSDIKASPWIIEASDLIMLIYRKGYYFQHTDDSAEIIIAKHNNGTCGVVNLTWNSNKAIFENKE